MFNRGDRVKINADLLGTITAAFDGQIEIKWDNGIVVAYTAWQIKHMAIVHA